MKCVSKIDQIKYTHSFPLKENKENDDAFDIIKIIKESNVKVTKFSLSSKNNWE